MKRVKRGLLRFIINHKRIERMFHNAKWFKRSVYREAQSIIEENAR